MTNKQLKEKIEEMLACDEIHENKKFLEMSDEYFSKDRHGAKAISLYLHGKVRRKYEEVIDFILSELDND